MAFCESTEPDLQYAGCALLLNIATLSEYLRQQVLDQFAVERLTELILQSDQENVQTVAAKALLTLVRKDTLLGDYVVATTIVPLTSLIVDLEAQIMRSLYGPLKEDMADLSQRQLFERITAHLVSFALLIDPRIMHLPADRSMDALLGCTVDFLTLPLMDHPFAPAEMRALSEVDAMSRQIRRRTSLRLGESGVSNRETSFSSLKEEIAIHALRLMMKYFTNPYAIDFVVRENVLTLVTAALDVHAVQEQAMITLSAASEIPALRTALLAVPFLWRGIDRVQKVSASHFPLTVFYENVCHFCDPATRGLVSDRYALFEKSEATPNLRISPQGFQLCNDSWTFESVRTKPAVSKSGRYAYEIVLKTDGIIQLGWASNHDDWDPEAGTGVGDDEHSYAVDGHRCKKWHGSAIENNNYGKAWSIGDVITALIDLDRKQLEYLHNGVSLGIAFSGIEDVPWHPAISLATGQACGARFGHRLDPLQYTPAGYEPFAVMLDKDLDIIPASTPSPNSRKVDFSTNTVPSARFPPYQFVARIGLGGLAEGCIPQMGVIDSRKTIVFLALGPDGRNAVVQAENIDPSDHTFFGALLLEKLVQTPDQETGLTVLASWPSEKADRLVEGDLLACIVDNARGEIRFTRNGSSYGPPVPSSLSEPLYSSYLRHVPRFLINLDVAPVNSGRIFA
ncbi:hypothetical protein DFJ77DRAFT_320334 [Powellomyces hirtus]|nr:hypothetical protein DFJ77DRAFT_320334 [Powellomyces hirtus]